MGWVGGGVGELVILFKYSVLRTGSCLELFGQLDEEMFTFFIIYYRTINQKDNMLYIELEKKACLSVYLQTQKFKTTVI